MSLKSFHRFFIALSLALFAFLAYWASGRNASGLVTPWLIWASAAGLAATVIVIANLVLLVRISVVVALVNPSLLPSVLPVTGAALLVGSIAAIAVWRRAAAGDAAPMPIVSNPAELKTSLGFGAIYGIVLLLAAWLSHEVGNAGLYALALASGLTDVDAITLSALRLNDLGRLAATDAATGIALAVLSNSAFKLGLVFVTAGRTLALRCLPPMAGAALGLVAGLLWIH
jgi:uncharacterized membrane protein (DUF4010 family)